MDGDQDLPPREEPRLVRGELQENNTHVSIGNEDYVKSWDGLLMPARKDQAPPDLRYFKQTQNGPRP